MNFIALNNDKTLSTNKCHFNSGMIWRWNVTPRQCEIAAESYAACLLAQAGYDVLIQYGPNQPDYDLVAVKGDRILPISVKGSQDGGWMLAVKYMKRGVTCSEAIDSWCSKQRDDIVYIFVQFLNVPIGNAPRVYIATPTQIAAQLKKQRSGNGHGALQEDYQKLHPRSHYDDRVPEEWKFSVELIDNVCSPG
jgi:hypothetical protein